MASTLETRHLKITTTGSDCNYVLVYKSDRLWHIYSKRTDEYLGSADKIQYAQELCRAWASAYGRVKAMQMSSPSKGGCYVTTACVEILHLADDGPELTALRRFREEHLRPTERGRAMLAVYAEAGPRLAEALRRAPSCDAEARHFYDLAVAPAVAALQLGDAETALRSYIAGMRDGLTRYGLAETRWLAALDSAAI